MTEIKYTWWIGRFAGILNGLQIRSDVPEDVRKMCERVLSELDEEMEND